MTGPVASSDAAFWALIRTPDLPGLGPAPRRSRRSGSVLERAVTEFCQAQAVVGATRESLRSAALLWHDHLESSHAISQSLATAEGSWLHGIMHRREPDYGNAAYWFRRVGTHPGFAGLAGIVVGHLAEVDAKPLAASLAPGGRWDPFAFIDACERAERNADRGLHAILQSVQQFEFECLIRSLLD